MSPNDSFAQWLARLDAGDEGAARQLFSRFTARLIALAGAQLDARIRQKIDPEDILQSVYRSFFRRRAAGEFDLQGWDRLWALLAVITVNKCKHWNRHFRAAGWDVGRETSLEPPPTDAPDNPDLLSRDPTPEQAAYLTDLVEQLQNELPPESRPILSLALQGCPITAICEQTGRSQRSVYRVLNQIRERLERRLADDAE